jgi:hypothetical protein
MVNGPPAIRAVPGTATGRTRWYQQVARRDRRALTRQHVPAIGLKHSQIGKKEADYGQRSQRFAQQNTERAVQATNYGMNWMREIAEQNLTQGKAALEGLLMITRKTVDGIDHQASVIRDRSMFLAEETLSNTFDFAQKLVRMKEPQELAQLQSEFVSRQAQVLGDQTKELGQTIMQGATAVAKTTLQGAAESQRKRSEAA